MVNIEIFSFSCFFQHNDHKTYFFKGAQFWEFDDLRMKVKDPSPAEIGHHWMHCPKPIKDPFKSLQTSSGSENSKKFNFLTLFALCVFVLEVCLKT